MNTNEKLEQAYEKMVERVHHLWDSGEGQHSLKQAILHARDKAEELQEITREDANKVADYVSRDLHEMGSYLHETGEELRDWFRFDVGLIEDRMLEKLISVADKTRLELAALQEHNREASRWHTGEAHPDEAHRSNLAGICVDRDSSGLAHRPARLGHEHGG